MISATSISRISSTSSTSSNKELSTAEQKPAELQPYMRRGHRHRRSAAISGDFDLQGMGLFLPPPAPNSNSALSKSVPGSLSGSPIKNTFITSYRNMKTSIPTDITTTDEFSGVDNIPAVTPSTGNPEFVITPETSTNPSPPSPPSPESNNYNVLNSPFRKPNIDFSSLGHGTGSPVLNQTPSTLSSEKFQFSSPVSTSSAATRFFMTEDARFERNSVVPKAVIDLNDIFKPIPVGLTSPKQTGVSIVYNGIQSSKGSRAMSAPELESFHIPKHSLLCSPKKSDVAIVEEIQEEDLEDENEIDEILLKNSVQNSESSSVNSILLSNTSAKGTPTLVGLSLNDKLILNDNCSSNSLNSLTSNNSSNNGTNVSSILNKNLTNINTPSIPNLRAKVRYQSYFNNQQKLNTQPTPTSATTTTSTTLSNISATSSSENILRSSKKTTLSPQQPLSSPVSRPVSKSRSPVRNSRYQGNTPHTSKNPFQFESVSYEIPKNFHRDHEYGKSMSLYDTSPMKHNSSNSTSSSNNHHHHRTTSRNHDALASSRGLADSSSSRSRSTSPLKHQRSRSLNTLWSPETSSSTKLSDPQQQSQENKDKHHRSSSLFRTISSKLHHRRKSSLLSTSSSKRNSIIEKTTDELLGLSHHEQQLDSTIMSSDIPHTPTSTNNTSMNNDSTLMLDELTFTDDYIGEPGPIIKVMTESTQNFPPPSLPKSATSSPSKHHRGSKSLSGIVLGDISRSNLYSSPACDNSIAGHGHSNSYGGEQDLITVEGTRHHDKKGIFHHHHHHSGKKGGNKLFNWMIKSKKPVA